jgi:hypothetical protein
MNYTDSSYLEEVRINSHLRRNAEKKIFKFNLLTSQIHDINKLENESIHLFRNQLLILDDNIAILKNELEDHKTINSTFDIEEYEKRINSLQSFIHTNEQFYLFKKSKIVRNIYILSLRIYTQSIC